MARHVVARVGEIPDGGRKVVDLDGIPVGVFHVNGDYFAILNRCPHQAAPLAEGHLWPGLLVSDQPGDYVNRQDIPVISCIWHGWEFDLRTGQSVCDPQRLRVRNYDVQVASGVEPQAEEIAATTYAVEQTGEWIVVDLDRRPNASRASSSDEASSRVGAQLPKHTSPVQHE
jgi:nitrite reductase/ring-hydroxylating ferredoxin subunit